MGFKRFYLENTDPYWSKKSNRLPRKNIISNDPTDAIHYGDGGMGHDTYQNRLFEPMSNRETGHFGTGTYFGSRKMFDMEDHSKDSETIENSKTPIKYLNLKGLNIFKVNDDKNEQEYYPSKSRVLHDTLREVNRVINVIATHGKKIDWSKQKEEWFNPRYKPELAQKLSKILGQPLSKINSVLQNISDMFHTNKDDGIRTPSTYFMQAFGYDGIDVRGNSETDTHGYGSVIYPDDEQLKSHGDEMRYKRSNKKDFDNTPENTMKPIVAKPEIAFKYAEKKGFDVNKEVVQSIANDPDLRKKYVTKKGGARYLDPQKDMPIITSSPSIAYDYAVLHDDETLAPEILKTIARDADTAYNYAHNLNFTNLPKVIYDVVKNDQDAQDVMKS